MDSNTTGVETKVSATLLTVAARVAAQPNARTTVRSMHACPRTASATTPKVRLQHVGRTTVGRFSGWQGDDQLGRTFGYAGSSKQMNNSIEFQIRLGPPCSPPA